MEKRTWKIIVLAELLLILAILFIPAIYIALGVSTMVVGTLIADAAISIVYNPFWFTLPGVITIFILGVVGSYIGYRTYVWIGKRYGKGRVIVTTMPMPASAPFQQPTQQAQPTAQPQLISTPTQSTQSPQVVVVEEKKQLEQKT